MSEPTDDGICARCEGPASRHLCDDCENAAVDALAAAPNLYNELRAAALVRGGTTQGEVVHTSRPGSFGLNGRPLFLSEQLHWVVCAWADEVINTARRPAVDRASQPEPAQVVDACLLLRTYMPVFLAHVMVEFSITRSDADPEDPKAQPTEHEVTLHQTGWEAAAWLIDWRYASEKALKKPPLFHYPPEPCPACDVPRSLKRRDGDDKVTCTNCGKAWTLDMYQTFVHAWIGAA